MGSQKSPFLIFFDPQTPLSDSDFRQSFFHNQSWQKTSMETWSLQERASTTLEHTT
jgi:hypothetical protein